MKIYIDSSKRNISVVITENNKIIMMKVIEVNGVRINKSNVKELKEPKEKGKLEDLKKKAINHLETILMKK